MQCSLLFSCVYTTILRCIYFLSFLKDSSFPVFLSSFLKAPRLPLFPSFAQFSEWLVFPPSKFSNRIRTQIPDKKTWNLTDLVSPFEFLSQTCFGWFLFFSCETLVGTSSLIAWWEAILEMLDSVVVCCFPPSVLRDWGLCLQTCLLFQPVFHTDLLKWPLPYSEQITPPGKQPQSGKTSDRLLSCDPSWSVTHSLSLSLLFSFVSLTAECLRKAFYWCQPFALKSYV